MYLARRRDRPATPATATPVRTSLKPATLMLLLALAGVLRAPALHAQDRAVYAGDRVRVTDAERWTGMVIGVAADTIHVVPDGERTARALALAGLRQLEISLGEKGRGRTFLVGGLVGAGVGAGTAAVVSASQTCEEKPDQFGIVPGCEVVGPVAIVASSIVGFAVGGAVGTLLGRGENWVRASPARVGSVRFELRWRGAARDQASSAQPISAR